MNHEHWLNKWQDNNIKFHLSETYELLVKYVTLLPTGKVLVPLCGKSLDMLWLIHHGYEVVGVELSPIACTDFFSENNIPFTTKKVDKFTVYEAPQIQIWCGDMFQLPSAACSGVTAIYDRAALFALPADMRQTYAQYIKKLVKSLSNVKILLVTIEFDDKKLEGPPFYVSAAEVRRLYGDMFTIEELESYNVSGFKNGERFKNIAVKDHIHYLTYPK